MGEFAPRGRIYAEATYRAMLTAAKQTGE